ncbi:nucleotide disphospho-sugar-binding domain-containing protein [Clostridium paraputrificum]|uniref:nucleotide disphospho-sugar-binding domain-containing protein n=1 Tax=Clostridium paraputrificum TaxID=29363 RepID=UPI003D33900F
MKYIVFTYPNYSHNKSIANFIKELSFNSNCEVYLFGNDEFKNIFADSNITFIPYPKGITNSLGNIVDAYNGLHKPTFNNLLEEVNYKGIFNTEYAIKSCLLYTSALIDTVKEINPDIILRDSCSLYGKFIGDSLSIPVIGYITNLVYTSNLIKTDIIKHFSNVLGLNLSNFSKDEVMDTYNSFENSVLDLCKKYKIPKITPLFTLDPNENFNIIFASQLLQPKLLNSSDIEYKISKPAIFSYMDKELVPEKKEKLIYVSTGSILTPPISFLNSIICAFKNSQYRVVISFPLAEDSRLTYNLPNNITIKKFVAQNEILEKACLFITHGGYNSLCESIYHLVPMLVYPLSNDQHLNASLIDNLQIGMDLRKYDLTPKTIKELSKITIDNELFIKNLINLKLSFNETLSYTEIIDSLNNIYNSKG